MTDHKPQLCILGIDPGGITGLASYIGGEWWLLQHSPQDAINFIRDWIAAHCPNYYTSTHVVMERFVPSARKLSFQPDALEIIGYTKYHCKDQEVSFSLQSPGDAKTLAPNTLLKTIGAYQAKTEHGLDAARHVVLHLHKHHPALLRTMKGTPSSG